ncbi:MarR family winged helix-turn-helix transcriptional regulator [Micromonospora sp. SL1-18]|uniref:MarR family winged helix-turn-helix transcriptional regulator n=1 Tax=Micromonospora sp. SL1-18 TaxID=3399128 RepID=UPI003A4E4BEB
MSDDLHDVLELAMSRLLRLRGVLDPSQASPSLGLSVSESLALARLAAGPATQHELGAYLGLEKSTVSRLVHGMMQKGWVEKERDPRNRRFQKVALTVAGEQTAARTREAMRAQHARWLDTLTADERRALAHGLGALVRAISADPGPTR